MLPFPSTPKLQGKNFNPKKKRKMLTAVRRSQVQENLSCLRLSRGAVNRTVVTVPTRHSDPVRSTASAPC